MVVTRGGGLTAEDERHHNGAIRRLNGQEVVVPNLNLAGIATAPAPGAPHQHKPCLPLFEQQASEGHATLGVGTIVVVASLTIENHEHQQYDHPQYGYQADQYPPAAAPGVVQPPHRQSQSG